MILPKVLSEIIHDYLMVSKDIIKYQKNKITRKIRQLNCWYYMDLLDGDIPPYKKFFNYALNHINNTDAVDSKIKIHEREYFYKIDLYYKYPDKYVPKMDKKISLYLTRFLNIQIG